MNRVVTKAAIVAAATAAIYWRALHAGFHGDDFMILHRLQALAGAADVARFFRGEFFEYYRPLPFVMHAIDWAIAGADARQFHLTNLLIHLASATLVLLIGQRLSPRSPAGLAAALLFALHAANHEAVVWISARFDLLATFFALASIYCVVRDTRGGRLLAPVLFFAAILSKESAVALPIAAAGFFVFCQRADRATVVRQLLPWLAALAVYGLLRNLAGGVSPVGGASRLPKLLALTAMLSVLVLVAGDRWQRVRDAIAARRGAILVGGMLVIAAIAVAANTAGRVGRLAAEKLAVAGFAGFYLASPIVDLEQPFYLDAAAPLYRWGGVIALAAALLLVLWLWRAWIHDDRLWFLGAFILGTLLPISALTEGTRYLYLPSAAVSLAIGILVAERTGATLRVATIAVVALLVISAVQINRKVTDWIWAGQLIAQGAQLVEETRPPGCGGEQIVFLNEPVAVRGVYTHFYYETFERPRGCMPESFFVVVRMMRIEESIDVRWSGPAQITMTAPAYRDTFVLAEDLRNFDRPLRKDARSAELRTPLGELRAEPAGPAERVTLTLAPGVRGDRTRFYYYSDGRMRLLPNP